MAEAAGGTAAALRPPAATTSIPRTRTSRGQRAQPADAAQLQLQTATEGPHSLTAAVRADSPAGSRGCPPIVCRERTHASWQAPASTGGCHAAAASDEESVGFRQPLVLSITHWLSWFARTQHHRFSHVFLRTLPEQTTRHHVAAASRSSSGSSSSSSSSFHSSTVVGPYQVSAVFCDVVSVCMICWRPSPAAFAAGIGYSFGIHPLSRLDRSVCAS